MKILHTGDWHLGATLENNSRDEEHGRFLEWLLETLKARGTELLLIAGDVFHYSQPSAEAQRLYYRFLSRLGETSVRKTVVVGGNHDSASRLEAPSTVLESLDVHVVGGLGAREEDWERCLCPVENAEGELEMVVLAVPFIHEFRLGVRTTLGDEKDTVQGQFRETFGRLYGQLASWAEERYPGAPQVAMGHMACSGQCPEHWGVEIHQMATVGGLPPDIFDARFSYVALGHIHQMYPVVNDTASVWYCGSPVALNRLEARTERYVLEVELDGEGSALVEPIPIPLARSIEVLEGRSEQVIERLRGLTWETPLPPFVFAEVEVEFYQPDLARQLLEILGERPEGDRPRLLRVAQRRIEVEPVAERDPLTEDALHDLTPEEVFRRLYVMKREQEPSEALLGAFRSLLTTT